MNLEGDDEGERMTVRMEGKLYMLIGQVFTDSVSINVESGFIRFLSPVP